MRIEQQANPSTRPVIVERWAEAVLRLVQRAKFLPLLREVEERAGERRCVFIGNSPLLNPAPEPVFRDGKDAFHRVPFIPGEVRDAVERILTKFRGARRAEIVRGVLSPLVPPGARRQNGVLGQSRLLRPRFSDCVLIN